MTFFASEILHPFYLIQRWILWWNYSLNISISRRLELAKFLFVDWFHFNVLNFDKFYFSGALVKLKSEFEVFLKLQLASKETIPSCRSRRSPAPVSSLEPNNISWDGCGKLYFLLVLNQIDYFVSLRQNSVLFPVF